MITLTEQIAEARRELALRRKLYPGFIRSKKLDMGEAMYQLKAMEAIVQTLTRLDANTRQLGLFGDH